MMQTDIFKVMADEYLKGVTEPEVTKPTPQGLGARSSLSMKNPEADANTIEPIKMGSAVDTVAKYYNKIIAEQIKDNRGNVSTEKGVEYTPVSYSLALDGAQDLAAAGYDFDKVLRDSAKSGKLSSATPPRNVKSDILSKIEYELSTEIAASKKRTKLDPYIDVTNRVQDSEGNIVRDKKSKQYRDEYFLDTGILLEEGSEPIGSLTRKERARQAIIDAKEKVKSAEDEYFLETSEIYDPEEFRGSAQSEYSRDPDFELEGNAPEEFRGRAQGEYSRGPDFELEGDAPKREGLGSRKAPDNQKSNPGFGENFDRNKKYSELLYDRFLGSGSPNEINKALLNTPEDQRQEVMDLILETMEADVDFEASPNIYKVGFVDDFVDAAKNLFGFDGGSDNFMKTPTFELLEGVEGFKTQAYSLNDMVTINGKPHKSGLTVGAGIDFGQHTKAGLEAMGLPQSLIDKADDAGWVGLNPDTIIDPETGVAAANRTRGHALMKERFDKQVKDKTLPVFSKVELEKSTPIMYKPYENSAKEAFDGMHGDGEYNKLSAGTKAVLTLEKYHRGQNYTLPDDMLKAAKLDDSLATAAFIKNTKRSKNMKDWLKKVGLDKTVTDDDTVVAETTTNVKVQGGDTMSAIAAKNNITLKELLAANPTIKDASKIKVGQTIKIPTADLAA